MEYDHYPEEEKKEHGPVFKVLKWLVILLIVAVYGILFFRMCVKEDTKLAESYLWTENGLAAYETWKASDSDTRGEFAYTQDNSYVVYNEDTRESIEYRYDTFSCRENTYSGDGSSPENSKEYIHYGQFHTSNPIYVPSAGEVQITLRYNDEGVEELLSTYGLSEEPQGELFVYTLTDGVNTYTDYSFVSDSRFTYEYRRLVFTGVEFEGVDELELMIYYVGDGTVDLAAPYEYFTVYLSDIPLQEYDMKDAKPYEVNGDLATPPYVVLTDSSSSEEE